MDPLTAALLAFTAAIDLVKEIIKSQPPEVAAELWRLHLEDVKAWRKFLEHFQPKESGRLIVHSALGSGNISETWPPKETP